MKKIAIQENNVTAREQYKQAWNKANEGPFIFYGIGGAGGIW